jgi:hypothetical protein
LKGNENSFKMIKFSKLLHDEYRSQDFDHEKEIKEKFKERIKNQS